MSAEKRTLLFVDDEDRILDGLRVLLRHKRKEWEMHFALGGAAALDKLGELHFDAVISDMRMPKMDGAQLLARTKELQPDTVRIILSGYSDTEAAMRALPVAHQYLSKPCDPKLLEETVERAIDLQKLIGAGSVRKAIGSVDKLPPLPATYAELTSALADERTSATDVARILERDMAMSAKLLQVVNSAFFRLGKPITGMAQAVGYLGFSMLKNLVLFNGIFGSESYPSVPGFSADALQRHSILTGRIAARFTDDAKLKDQAFLAGVVLDIGELVLAKHMPAEFAEVLEQARAEKRSVHLVEEERWGVSHAEVGAYLIGIWGLPFAVVESTANHHHPARIPSSDCSLAVLTHVADVLGDEPVRMDELDIAHLTSLGLVERLPKWKAIATEERERHG